MASNKGKERGPSSSAGLVTYYDADAKNALHIKPAAVLIIAGIIGVAVYVINLIIKNNIH